MHFLYRTCAGRRSKSSFLLINRNLLLVVAEEVVEGDGGRGAADAEFLDNARKGMCYMTVTKKALIVTVLF